MPISAGHQPTTRIARSCAAAARFDWAFMDIRREDSYRLPPEVSIVEFFFALPVAAFYPKESHQTLPRKPVDYGIFITSWEATEWIIRRVYELMSKAYRSQQRLAC